MVWPAPSAASADLGKGSLDPIGQVHAVDRRLASLGADQVDGVTGVGEDPPRVGDLGQVVAGRSEPGEVAVAGQADQDLGGTAAAHEHSLLSWVAPEHPARPMLV
ncbi:MAG: hypothetical protein WKF51_10425 [Geodermatophilaceae bacterium]